MQCVKGATLKQGSKVRGSAILTPDVTIGKMALVGAGSVALEDAPRAAVGDNPVRMIRRVEELQCLYNRG